MLNGKDLGRAIKEAYELKEAKGSVKSKADVARHFGIRTPSIYDWFKKGSIGKEKLPELFRYFSDVVDYGHWGLSETEWPLGLSSPPGQDNRQPETKPNAKATTIKPKSRHQERVDEIVALLQQTDMEGLAVMLDRARDAARDYPLVKKTPKLFR